MFITWLDFEEILLKTFLFGKFSLKNLDVFFQGQTLFWINHTNGWSNWSEMKRSASVGYWVYYVTLIFYFTYDFCVTKVG